MKLKFSHNVSNKRYAIMPNTGEDDEAVSVSAWMKL